MTNFETLHNMTKEELAFYLSLNILGENQNENKRKEIYEKTLKWLDLECIFPKLVGPRIYPDKYLKDWEDKNNER